MCSPSRSRKKKVRFSSISARPSAKRERWESLQNPVWRPSLIMAARISKDSSTVTPWMRSKPASSNGSVSKVFPIKYASKSARMRYNVLNAEVLRGSGHRDALHQSGRCRAAAECRFADADTGDRDLSFKRDAARIYRGHERSDARDP